MMETGNGDDRKRESVHELTTRDWERTRDQELEQQKRERTGEYEDRYDYQNPKRQQSASPPRDRQHRLREHGKVNEPHPIEAFKTSPGDIEYDTKDDTRSRALLDIKKGPSIKKEKKEEKDTVIDNFPVKEKKRDGKKKIKKKKKRKRIDKAKYEEKYVTPVTKLINIHAIEEKQPEGIVKENVMPIPVPQLSKWESDYDLQSTEENTGSESGCISGDEKIVTSEVLKRAENFILQKGMFAIRRYDSDSSSYTGSESSVEVRKKRKKKFSKKKTRKRKLNDCSSEFNTKETSSLDSDVEKK